MLWFAVSASLMVDVLIAFMFFRIGRRKGRQEILLSKPYGEFVKHTITKRAKSIIAEHRIRSPLYEPLWNTHEHKEANNEIV